MSPSAVFRFLCLIILSLASLSLLNAQVNANFASGNLSGCGPHTVTFNDLSSGSIHEYLWDFGNGNTSRLRNPSIIYVTPGQYTISLTVRDTINNLTSTNTKVDYITVFEDPQPALLPSVTAGCAPLTVDFTDQTTSGDTTIVAWLWDFGDGVTSTDQNPSHTFIYGGSYDVTLVVTDANGCDNSFVAYDIINVSNGLSVDFSTTPSIACSAPQVVSFTSNINPPGSYTYLWDFGDGNTSAAQNPFHNYTAQGTYSITLSVEDQNGCISTQTKYDEVIIQEPVADFVPLSTTICTGQPLQFINTTNGADGYAWSFGDGGTSTDQDPTYTYLNPGTYSVGLVATNSGGCSDAEVKTALITVFPATGVDFDADVRFGCSIPMTVNFTDLSTDATAWVWDFGDGFTSTQQNPTHIYTSTGLFTVSLTITNSNGCVQTESRNAYVQVSPPITSFIAGPELEGCTPLTVNFQNNSTSIDPITNYFWSFGDGATSFDTNPTHTYTTEGEFNVILIAVTQSGCRDTTIYQDYITVGDSPNAEFTGNPRVVCLDETVAFTDQSSAGSEWEWSFGDGGGSQDQNPLYAYQDTGLFDVTLVINNLGCRDTIIKEDYILVQVPQAEFTFSPLEACSPPVNVSFIDQSSSPDTWLWDFGDGNSSTLQNPNHTYTSSGTFNITLIVTNNSTGCTDSVQHSIVIGNPQASFTGDPLFGCPGLTVNFANTSLGSTSYLWSFGDGDTVSTTNPIHTYDTPGVYDVMLIASEGNCSDTLIRTGYVTIAGASVNFSADTLTGCAPLVVNFSDSSMVPSGGTITNWLWDFGDGNVSGVQNPTHSFDTAGYYTVSLTTLDSYGCLQTHEKVAYIHPTFPSADFISTDTISCPGTFVSFTSLAQGEGLNHLWDFGDGTTSTSINPVHVFPGNGNYSVSLTVTDLNGCVDANAKTDYIFIGNPTADFDADTTTAECPPLEVTFADQSSSDVTNWYWDFGEGSTSQLTNPSKIYNSAGSFTVSLIVETLQGCRDTMTKANFVNLQGPNGSFTFTPKEGCRPREVTFTGAGTDIADYTWFFGDGSTGSGQTVSHTYITDTTLTPVMLIEDVNGCQVAITTPDSIIIRPLPEPDFAVDYDDICLGQTANFTNTTVSKRTVTNYLWDFGDGTISNLPNPSHTYIATGTYQVSLIATTVDGCIDTVSAPTSISVTEPPLAFFSVSPSQDCTPASIAFQDSSFGAFPIVDWQWVFGDGDSASGQVILPHTYDSSAVYNPTLIVTDSVGCTATASVPVTALPLPVPAFSANRYGCAPITIQFTDTTNHPAPIVSWFWDFGDGGATSTAQNPLHTFNANGDYTVSLTTTDIYGCIQTTTIPRYIQLRKPIAGFSSDAVPSCPGTEVNFSNSSFEDTTSSYVWDFGDGGTSTTLNPSHTYHTPGTYDVELIITNIFGCADTLLLPDHVTIFQPPTADMVISDTATCVPYTMSVTQNVTPGDTALTDYAWDFGGGTLQFGPTASYLYNFAGSYVLELVATDANGCRDTTSQNISIYPNPTANFSADDTLGCSIKNIAFTDLSTTNYTIVDWQWDFGDGLTAIIPNPSHTYFNDGQYSVSLKVTDNHGCVDSMLKVNYVSLEHPVADFAVSDTQACTTTVLSFEDRSTGQSALTLWEWDFGDGNNGIGTNPIHTYTVPGTYSIELVVEDVYGCRDTVVKPNQVHVPIPASPNFTFSPNAVCAPASISFTDLSIANDAPITTWSWDFGDGSFSNQLNPVHTYTAGGDYDVTLTVTDANGCNTFITQTVNIRPLPPVDFDATPRIGCGPQSIDFTDETVHPYNLVNWYWDFGDGNSSTLRNPTHVYVNDGNYTVKLIATDQFGCTDSLTRINYIRLSHPVAGFVMSADSVCPSNPIGVQFTDASIPDTTITDWLWDFGDGNSSTLQSPSYAYLTPGTYTVRLIVTNAIGCMDTVTSTDPVLVRNGPTASFASTVNDGCEPLEVGFTDTSSPGDAVVIGWSWDFGDGNTSLNQNPIHTFATAGTYTVSLTATDNNGCEHTVTRNIEVFGRPTADFQALSRVGCSPQAIDFVDLSTGPAFVNAWEWDFGDGGSSSAKNPTYTYVADGLYDVTLRIQDANGCRDTITKINYIHLRHPQARFTQDLDEGCPGTSIQFTDASIPDTTLTNWFWDFGDGNTSTLQHPIHIYDSSGMFTVSLTVTNLLGCSHSISKTDTVHIFTPPTTRIAVSDQNGCAPLLTTFSDNSISNSAPIISWTWDLGNGQNAFIPNPPIQQYDSVGIYQIVLRTVDANGCSSADTMNIEVFDLPTANFVADQQIGCAPVNVNFADLSTGVSPIANWWWDYGDGNTSTGQANPSHTYASNGIYDVEMIVEDQNGCRDTLTRAQYLRFQPPNVDFTIDNDQGCTGLPVTFTDLSSSDTTLVNWAWDFGDGGTSTQQHPVYIYNSPGTYTVSLTATNQINCSATITKVDTIVIHESPIADFSVADTMGCVPFDPIIQNLSSSNVTTITSNLWDFGDGNSSNQANPSYLYTNGGTYNLVLSIEDANGCVASDSMRIYANDLPVASFTADTRRACPPATVQFTSTSTGSSPLVSWSWDFGDGFTSTQENPNHTYSNVGSYDVSLITADQMGCSDTILLADYIELSQPEVDFSLNNDKGCPGLPVQFQNLTISDTTIVAYLWDFGDGNTSASINPQHIYSSPGVYTVSLTATSILGCAITETKVDTIEIFTPPSAQFLPDQSVNCTPLTIVFSDASISNSAPITNWEWSFGDGTSATSQNTSHTYTISGQYDVVLITQDTNGCKDTASLTVEALPGPLVDFSATNRRGCAPINVQFTDLSGGTYAAVDWLWDFGDGTTSTQQNPSHTYVADGIYSVSLTVTDANGCVSFLSKPDFIRFSHPIADFSLDKIQICPGDLISFTDLSSGDTTLSNWLWDFGDGNGSTERNPSHLYHQSGIYSVSLTVEDVLGCTHTIVKTDTLNVLQRPDAQIVATDPQGCVPHATAFVNNTVSNGAPIASYFWDFGNGTTSTFPSPNINYFSSGVYQVQLIATDQNSCADTATISVEAFANPVAGFVAGDSLGCSDFTTNFVDQSIGNYVISDWNWSFGDGNTSINQFPTHTYLQDGNYDVSLAIMDVNGCVDTLTRREYIRLSHPQAAFSLDITEGCTGSTVSFTDESIPDTTLSNWLWDFGDGTTSNLPNPTHLYTQAGTYTVSLTITNIHGCSDTETRINVINILQGPLAAFVYADSSGCVPFENSFTDQSVGNDAPIIEWNWSFGNGDSSMMRNPDYTYGTGGDFVVNLEVVDQNGCVSNAQRQVAAFSLPVADFRTFDTVGCAPFTAQFTSASTGERNIVEWRWDFGDGGTSIVQNPDHLYTRDGTYDISLIVFDEEGCSDTLFQASRIFLSNPRANFTADRQTICRGESIQFSDLSVSDTTSIVGYRWLFGDGEDSFEQNPSHTYHTAGLFDVSLIISNEVGCTDTMHLPNFIRVMDAPNTAILTPDSNVCVPSVVTFSDISTSLNPIIDRTWYIDSLSTSKSINASQYFDQVGTYTISLVLTDLNGCKDSTSMILGVHGLPTAAFTADDTLSCAPLPLAFRDLSSGPSRITEWEWDFGNGATSSEQNPVNIYTGNGDYDVSLLVTDEFGCKDSLLKPAFVSLSNPVANFYVDYDPGCPPVLAKFYAEGSGQAPIVRYDWDFGDGGTALGDSVTYSYENSGIYGVTLIATDSLGCSDTVFVDSLVDATQNIRPGEVELQRVSVNGDQSVEIIFHPFTGEDFFKYYIYRESKLDPGTWIKIDSTFFIDDTLHYDFGAVEPIDTRLESYCYKITAANSCGTESELGRTEEHCTINAEAIAVPDEIIIQWNHYEGWNAIESYEVYRVLTYDPNDVSFMGVVPGNIAEFRDETTECYEDYIYRVKARGALVEQISWSDTTAASNVRNIRANPNEMVRATVENNAHISVEWDTFEELDNVVLIDVERRTAITDWQTIVKAQPEELKYIDTDVNVMESSYSYRVSATDSCGYKNPISNIGKSILLDVEQESFRQELSWSAYEGWKNGVDFYEIQIYSDTLGGYKLIDKVNGNQLSYTDNFTTLDQPSYCYRIVAYELGGNLTNSVSNEVCLEVITHIYFPNAFTPNDDGVNDFFRINGVNVQSVNLKIFTRWGVKVFETNDIAKAWDGKFNGGLSPEGVYVAIAKGVGYDGRPFNKQMTVTLFR